MDEWLNLSGNSSCGHSQIVDPDVLIDWRAYTDVRRDQELRELERRTVACAEEDVMPIDN